MPNIVNKRTKEMSDENSAMRLDLSDGAGNPFYDNRKENTMLQLNELYGQDAMPEDYKRGMYYKYLKIVGNCVAQVLFCGPKSCPSTCVEVPQGMIGLKMEGGSFVGKLRPGLHSVNPFLHTVRLVELRAQALSLPHQYVLSKDNVTFEIDALINYRIRFPEIAIFKLDNYALYAMNIAAAALKTVISENTFSQVLLHRDKINQLIVEYMEPRLETWGLEVDLVETQSIVLAEHLHSAMAQVAESESRAKAKVVDALGHLESSKVYIEAAEVYEQSEHSMMLQRWDAMQQIGHQKCMSVVVPHDILFNLANMLGGPSNSEPNPPKTPFDE